MAASAPGTAPYFTLAWFLKKNGLSVKDVTVVNLEPGPAAGLHRRPERRRDDLRGLSLVRARRAASRQDHRDDARLPDDHGHVRLHADFLDKNPKAAKALADSYFEAVEMIGREPAVLRDHGRRREADRAVRQLGQVPALAGPRGEQDVLRLEFETFSNEAADLLLEIGIIKQKPDIKTIVDTRFIQ